MVERPEMSSRRATSIRCFFDALASTPSADLPFGIGSTAARPGIGRPLLSLRLPVVADLLEAVLQRVVGDAVRTLTFAVLLGGRIVHLGERPLRLGGRLLQCARQLALLRSAALALSSASWCSSIEKGSRVAARDAGITCTRAAFLTALRTWCATSNGCIPWRYPDGMQLNQLGNSAAKRLTGSSRSRPAACRCPSSS